LLNPFCAIGVRRSKLTEHSFLHSGTRLRQTAGDVARQLIFLIVAHDPVEHSCLSEVVFILRAGGGKPAELSFEKIRIALALQVIFSKVCGAKQ